MAAHVAPPGDATPTERRALWRRRVSGVATPSSRHGDATFCAARIRAVPAESEVLPKWQIEQQWLENSTWVNCLELLLAQCRNVWHRVESVQTQRDCTDAVKTRQNAGKTSSCGSHEKCTRFAADASRGSNGKTSSHHRDSISLCEWVSQPENGLVQSTVCC